MSLKFIVVHNDPASLLTTTIIFISPSCHAHTDTINMRIKVFILWFGKKLQQFNPLMRHVIVTGMCEMG
jgi:hypothetical protein